MAKLFGTLAVMGAAAALVWWRMRQEESPEVEEVMTGEF